MNNRWIKMRMSSMDKRAIGKLNDTNHIENFRDSVLEIYGIVTVQETVVRGYGVEYAITSWVDEEMLKDKNDLPLDIMVYKKYDEGGRSIEGMFTWEPFVEYKFRKQLFEQNKEITDYSFGYIDGRRHHCGHFNESARIEANSHPWYIMWQEFHCKPVEPLKQEMNIENKENK